MATNPFGDNSTNDDGSTRGERILKKIKKWSTYETDQPVFKLSDLSDEEKEQIESNMNKPIEDIDFELLRLIKLIKDMPFTPYISLVSIYDADGLGRGSYMDPDVKYLAQNRIIPENYLRSSFDIQLFRIRPNIMNFLRANEPLWLDRERLKKPRM